MVNFQSAPTLPQWAGNLQALGMPLDKLIRKDGLGLVTRPALKEKMGDAKFNAVSAIAHAAVNKDFGVKDLTTHKSKTAKLLANMGPLQHHPEVAQFVREILDNTTLVDSRMQHYIQRRYVEKLWDKPLTTFDALFKRIIMSPDSAVHRKTGGRYQIRSTGEGWIAIIEPTGIRVSLYPDLGDDLGEPLWMIRSLLE